MKVTSPLYIDLPRKTTKDKRVYLNLNVYRNLYHQTNNEVKKAYLEAVKSQLEGKQIKTPVNITYQVFKGSNRKLDKMNVVSIVSKFLLDSVTELGCWPDDNDEYVKTEIILPTELDRTNPRVEITFKTLNK